MTTLIDKYKAKGLYCLFVDFKAAFDSIDRTKLINKLHNTNRLPQNLIDILAALHSNVKATIKGDTESFTENVGVKQGDPLGPRLFNVYINDLPDAATTPTYGSRVLHANRAIQHSYSMPTLRR